MKRFRLKQVRNMDEKDKTNIGNLEKEANNTYISNRDMKNPAIGGEEELWKYEYFISFLGDDTKSISSKSLALELIEKYTPPLYYEQLKYANSIILRFNDQNLEAQMELLESIKNLENCRIERGNLYYPTVLEDISKSE